MSVLWTSAEAVAATGGRNNAEWSATGVSIDSRNLAAGDLFVALVGPSHDGHDYIAAALGAGAAAAIVGRVPRGLPIDASLLVVADTLQALRDLGTAARRRSAARIAAITGSVGKTGTKEMLKLALEAQAPTHASASSLNNHIGVPLTLARLPRAAVYAVFEIGMNHPGEIAPLAQLVRPHVAVVTTVEPVHLEFFPDGVRGVAAAKAEIFASLAGGTAVLNRDNPHFDFLADAARAAGVARVIGFGAHPAADVRLAEFDGRATESSIVAAIHGRRISYRLGVAGRHWAVNSLAVLAAVDALGAGVELAARALARMAPPKGRGRRHRLNRNGQRFELIDDSYNASPASMRAAFDVLAAAEPGASGRRIAVLGDMLELGRESAALHAGLAEPLLKAGADLVFTCGRDMTALDAALPADRRGGHAADSTALLPAVRAAIRGGDVVLVKGSLGSRMGPIVDALIAEGTSGNGAAGPSTPARRAANG
jgi:UDP-N-acetylmuramoyl-tripeptide--D-alanyl-D-alanine ligase